jgi:hypothetical protein
LTSKLANRNHRVVAVIRRHVLADREPSAWMTLGRAAAAAVRG